jgi:hypothetical protein
MAQISGVFNASNITAMMKEAVRTSETTVSFYKATQRNITLILVAVRTQNLTIWLFIALVSH